MQFLERLEKAANDMVDFKYYDMEVGKEGLRVKSKNAANAYKDPVLSCPAYSPFMHGKSLELKATYVGNAGPAKGSDYDLIFSFNSKEEAHKAFAKMESADSLDRHILLTRLLEDKEALLAAQKAKEESAKAQKDSFISKLMNNFGTEK